MFDKSKRPSLPTDEVKKKKRPKDTFVGNSKKNGLERKRSASRGWIFCKRGQRGEQERAMSSEESSRGPIYPGLNMSSGSEV